MLFNEFLADAPISLCAVGVHLLEYRLQVIEALGCDGLVGAIEAESDLSIFNTVMDLVLDILFEHVGGKEAGDILR